MRFFFIVSSFPWSADANNVKAFILPRRKLRLLKEILVTSGVKYISVFNWELNVESKMLRKDALEKNV